MESFKECQRIRPLELSDFDLPRLSSFIFVFENLFFSVEEENEILSKRFASYPKETELRYIKYHPREVRELSSQILFSDV